jgi:hypothetical protein
MARSKHAAKLNISTLKTSLMLQLYPRPPLHDRQ